MCYCKLKVACCSPATGDVRCGADHWRKGGRDGEREREVGVGGKPTKISSLVAITTHKLNIVTFKRICNSAEKSY